MGAPDKNFQDRFNATRPPAGWWEILLAGDRVLGKRSDEMRYSQVVRKPFAGEEDPSRSPWMRPNPKIGPETTRGASG